MATENSVGQGFFNRCIICNLRDSATNQAAS